MKVPLSYLLNQETDFIVNNTYESNCLPIVLSTFLLSTFY